MKNHYGYKHLRVSLLICLRLRWYGIERVDVCFEIHLQMGMIQLFLLDMLNIIYIKKCQR